MHDQSPFVARRLLPEQTNKHRARVKLAVLTVLAVHGIGMLALLVQGSQQELETTTPAGAGATNAAPPPFTSSATSTSPFEENPGNVFA